MDKGKFSLFFVKIFYLLQSETKFKFICFSVSWKRYFYNLLKNKITATFTRKENYAFLYLLRLTLETDEKK
ncbi:MAG: hypothetical protein DRZ79_02430 [Candidatus Cloacimonadota bacterium]|nr:MAG: hypothetical protein DRZ79_02430 [Candidatus Cloacimonadota bacterium]